MGMSRVPLSLSKGALELSRTWGAVSVNLKIKAVYSLTQQR